MVAYIIRLELFCKTWTYINGETNAQILLQTNSESHIKIDFKCISMKIHAHLKRLNCETT